MLAPTSSRAPFQTTCCQTATNSHSRQCPPSSPQRLICLCPLIWVDHFSPSLSPRALLACRTPVLLMAPGCFPIGWSSLAGLTPPSPATVSLYTLSDTLLCLLSHPLLSLYITQSFFTCKGHFHHETQFLEGEAHLCCRFPLYHRSLCSAHCEL